MNKDSLANKLVREILTRIVSGECATDARLPSERALCEEFHLSRGTVREALSTLTELGAIEVRHGSGTYVRSLSQRGVPDDYLPPGIAKVSLEEILCARTAIETVAAEAACKRISASEVKELDALIARMEADIEDLPEFLKHDLTFHEKIVRASGNCPLITAFEAIREYLRYFQVFTTRCAGGETLAIDHHRQILDALRRRDAKGAALAAKRHLNTIGRGRAKTDGKRKPVRLK